MTERLIQDNKTPPLSASLKVVVKSATTSVREFKSGLLQPLLQPVVVSIGLTYFTVSSKLAPGTEAHFSSEAALSTWWYPQQIRPRYSGSASVCRPEGIPWGPWRNRFKSDLRNHQAIVQPRLCDSLMVTQITLSS